MAGNISAIAVLFQPMAVMITLVYAYGVFSRQTQSPRLRNALLGLLFGFAALLSMEMPIELGEGIIVDLRNLFIGLAAALMGWMAGLIALMIGLAMRIYLGGAGMVSGITAMGFAFAGAAIWRFWLLPRMRARWMAHITLGLAISTHLAAVAFLPSEIAFKFLFGLGPMFLVFNVLGAVLVGEMFHREGIAVSENEQLKIDATTDPLTKLMNRRSLIQSFDTLEQLNHSDHGRAILYFDVDRFKQINDTFGHQIGDQTLQSISRRVADCLRPADLFGRLGGDEFLVILPSVTIQSAMIIAERCREAVASTPIISDGKSIDVSISVGVEHVADKPSFVRDLAAADAALYRSKELGRNRVSIGAAAPAAA